MNTEVLPEASLVHKGSSPSALEAARTILSSVGILRLVNSLSDLDITKRPEDGVLLLYWPVAGERKFIGWFREDQRSHKWPWYLDYCYRSKQGPPAPKVVSISSSAGPTTEVSLTVETTKAERTLTEVWIEKQVREQALDRRVVAIMSRKNTESHDDLLSITGLWFAEWSKKGTFDAYLEKGKPPGVATLACWVGRKLCHERYQIGTDALSRHMTGARTECEVRKIRKAREESDQKGGPVKLVLMPGAELIDPRAPKVVASSAGEDVPTNEFDLVAPAEVSDEVSTPAEISLVHDIIRVRRPAAAARYIRICDYMLAGLPREEVAIKEDIEVRRVKHLCQRVRDDLAAAPVLVEVALRILALVSQEPWSEMAEIEAEIDISKTKGGVDDKGDKSDKGDTPGVDMAMKLLKIRGLIEEKKGSYILTQQGHGVNETQILA